MTANFAKPDNKPAIGGNDRAKPIGGEREYYIPSYNSPQLIPQPTQQQRQPQEFIYPNNFRNAYQYKYTNNRVPDVVNHRQWPAPGVTIGRSQQALQPNDRYDSRDSYESNRGQAVDNSLADNYRHNDYETKRPPKYHLGPNDDKHDTNRQKSALKATQFRGNSRVRDFSEEQERLARPLMTGNDEEYRDSSNNNDNNDIKLSDLLIQPVMRRKSAANTDNQMHTSALQSSEHRNIPIPLAIQQNVDDSSNGSLSDIYFVAIVACVSAVAIIGTIGAGICVYKVQQSNKAAADVDYPAYGVVGPISKEANASGGGSLSPSGDRKLAQSAQMYHYHHQKQQMIASEKAVTPRRNSASDVESDEENEEGEYTVYECPGLAPTGEMEVKNPLFHDDITPVSSSPQTTNTKEK
ncbi:unnamed protein product [Medioppia subpectinata]|nr:unnamed protein product [Medioppia subpectinata]CAG2107122.1 unnamed protein product [Medioppia subpectinata]